jgi:DNA-binding transcriptional regulator YdaS (Cro superfamily)
MQTIGNIIGSLIYGSGKTQKELAKEMGIKSASLNQMLSGRIKFPKERILQVLKLINASKEDVDRINEILVKSASLSGINVINNSHHSKIIHSHHHVEEDTYAKAICTKIKDLSELDKLEVLKKIEELRDKRNKN